MDDQSAREGQAETLIDTQRIIEGSTQDEKQKRIADLLSQLEDARRKEEELSSQLELERLGRIEAEARENEWKIRAEEAENEKEKLEREIASLKASVSEAITVISLVFLIRGMMSTDGASKSLVEIGKREEEEDEIKPFSFLNFPNEILLKIYPHLDFSSRRALRVTKRMEGIELEMKHKYGTLDINMLDNTLVCDGVVVAIDEGGMKKELEMLKSTHFDRVTYKTSAFVDKGTIESTKFLNATTINIDYPFPLLFLSNKVIASIVSFLPMKDRLKARVNKRLDEIELESKYYVKNLYIQDRNIFNDIPHDRTVVTVRNSCDFLRRIAQNVSINCLGVFLIASGANQREVCNFIKKLNLYELYLSLNDQLHQEVMVDSYFLKISTICQELSISRHLMVSEDAFLRVCKSVIDGSTKLRNFKCDINKELCDSFLKLIGVTRRGNNFFSNRNIEAYKWKDEDSEEEEEEADKDDYDFMHFFYGNMEITIWKTIFVYPSGEFGLKWYETQESLEDAKDECVFCKKNILGPGTE